MTDRDLLHEIEIERDLARISFEKVSAGSAGLGTVPALNGMEVARLCYAAGWHDVWTLAAAIGTFASEALFHPAAFHQNVDADGNVVSTDWGMCQINDAAHPEFFPGGSPANALDPQKAIAKSFEIWNAAGQSFDPWFGHKNQVYLDDYYLRRSWLAILNMGAARWITLAEARPDVVAGRTTPPTKTHPTMITLSDLRKIYPPGT